MDKLLEILQGIEPDIDFEHSESLIDDGLLGSFAIVNLIYELTEAFDIEIPTEEIIPENFNSVKRMMAMIERLQDE